MPSTFRRQLLRIGGLTAAGTIAGCTDLLAEEAPETRLTFLLFHNFTDEAHSVAVRIEDETTTLYEETVTMDPHSSELLPPDTVTSDGYPTDPGHYDVVFRLQTQADTAGRADVDLGTVDHECVGYTVEVAPAENEDDPRLTVFPNTGCTRGRSGDETT